MFDQLEMKPLNELGNQLIHLSDRILSLCGENRRYSGWYEGP